MLELEIKTQDTQLKFVLLRTIFRMVAGSSQNRAEVWRFPIYPLPPTHLPHYLPASPMRCTFLTTDEPSQSLQFTLEFTLGIHSVGLYKCIKS